MSVPKEPAPPIPALPAEDVEHDPYDLPDDDPTGALSPLPDADDDDDPPFDDDDPVAPLPALAAPPDADDAVDPLDEDEASGALAPVWTGDPEEDVPTVALPWSTEASIPELDLTVPCLCDPTAARTVLYLPEPPDTDRLEVGILVGPLAVRVLVTIEVAAGARLRLGRDVLAGRAVVRC
jgi:hypothetical protein